MTGRSTPQRARTRSAARLAAVQALYQREMERTPVARLLDEFHQHRLGRVIEDLEMEQADVPFFDSLVQGVAARQQDLDALVGGKLARGWTLERMDKTMLQVLRAGAFELLARPDVPKAAAISEYVDVAKAFFDDDQARFVNGVLDAVAREVRP
ncbi:transcription antitermination factor NusB [Erythrobacteraceae bacterium CFH 75059]|uniref:transcription antitermination factor NusB n=1 Tax=Qipengyuania thermophila TaxID=2509361 RepID=UPI0010212ACF|nr:transcription antitermination factor NusB [Qipengyuania thermophila]TCD04925.1 transcription antitermination factor NusB [Erythrobacteraceae bacterium CFH 75059]